jgi:hypothetical protein
MSEPKQIIRYDYNYLIRFCKENDILTENIEYYKKTKNKENKTYDIEKIDADKINRDTYVETLCLKIDCKDKCIKRFREIIIYGCYCKTHTQEKKLEKIKTTTFTKHGVFHNSQMQEIKIKKKETCKKNHGVEYPTQNKEVREKVRQSCLETYGTTNPMQNKEVREKAKKTNLINLGVEYPTQNKEVREKCKKTTFINYGVENVSQNEHIKKVKEETCLKNHGVKYPSQSEEILKKQQETMMSNIGVKHALQSEEIRNKIKSDCLVKYGKEHFMQVPEIAEKSFNNSFKIKEYILPSGTSIKYQGYENYVWDELLKTTEELNIITGCRNVPTILYKDSEGTEHIHFVDFFIPSQNKCIECKSTFTLGIKKDNIFLKQKTGKALGYEYEIWVYNSKGEKVECYK